MTKPHLTVAYTNAYQRWQLAPGHPTDPVRAKHAMTLLRDVLPAEQLRVIEPDYRERTAERLGLVHTAEYLSDVRTKYLSDEWEGKRPILAATAELMAEGTFMLWDEVMRTEWDPRVYFNPMGAKHHAMRSASSGFCVFNDMAAVATMASMMGRKVLYVDWDVHHGDGVESICRFDTEVLTASIHGSGIFPGTGDRDILDDLVLNYPLEAGADDGDLEGSLRHLLGEVTRLGHQPDIVLLAAGADGLGVDPLGNLNYTIKGLAQAGAILGNWAGRRGLPVIVGGAGGYTPHKETPVAWASTVISLMRAHSLGLARVRP
jgi:acetoin utilization protein AcuC